MQTRTLCSVMLGVAAAITSLVAYAQPLEPVAGTVGASASRVRIGLDLVPMPFGTLTIVAGNVTASSDAAFAFGLAPFFDYSVHPNFFIGVSPQYIFNVKGKDDTGSAGKEFDILLRLGGNAPVADRLQLYGYLAPGYSVIILPSGTGLDNPKGFVLGVHAGGMLDVTPALFVNAELGYQVGFQSISQNGRTADLKSNFFQIGLGGGIRL